MLTVAGTLAIAIATDLSNFALIARNDLLPAIDGVLLARAHRGDLWGGERPSAARLRQAALEARGARAQTGLGVARAALVGETAVTATTALGLGAAFDVGGSARAGVADVLAAALGAVCGGDADTWCAALALAGTVLGSAGFEQHVAFEDVVEDEAGMVIEGAGLLAEHTGGEEEEGGDGGELHGCGLGPGLGDLFSLCFGLKKRFLEAWKPLYTPLPASHVKESTQNSKRMSPLRRIKGA